MNTEQTSVVPELSVVMPCYNESEGIEELLKEWTTFLDETVGNYEFLVVNDGSKDGTGRILDRLRREMKNLRVIHQLNTGHGRAVRRGYEAARGRYVLQVDASGRYEPTDIAPLWEKRGYHPLVLGIRAHRLDGITDRLFSKGLNHFSRWLYGCRLHDVDVPFRIFRREIARPYIENIARGSQAINALLSVLWFRDYPDQVCEVPVPHRLRPGRNRLRDAPSSLTRRIIIASHYLEELWRHRSTFASPRPALPFPAR